MARLGIAPRIIGLFFLLIGLVFGGIFWFDFLGLIDASTILNPVTSLFGVKKLTVDADNPVLLDELRIRKQEESLDLRFQELNNVKNDLEKIDLEIAQRVAEVDEREKALDDRENSFNQVKQQYDDKERNLVQNSNWLTSMRPEKAIDILNGYNDQDLIDLLRKTEEIAVQSGVQSLVSVWLAGLPKERTSEIQRKMTIKPSGL
jgi:flagellar protein FlbB